MVLGDSGERKHVHTVTRNIAERITPLTSGAWKGPKGHSFLQLLELYP